MSLITIQSQRNDAGDGLEHGYIQNHFTQPIIINPGDTISLVNLTMTKVSGIEISAANDTLIWRFGDGPTVNAGVNAIPAFEQHIVKLSHGTYTVEQLVTELQFKLQDSVKIGCFAPQGQAAKGFTVTYDKTSKVLSIIMDLSVVPTAPNAPFGLDQIKPYISGNPANPVNQTVVPLKELYTTDPTGVPIPPTFVMRGFSPLETPDINIGGQFSFNQFSFFDSGVANALSTAETGIFCNGGTTSMITDSNRGQRRVDLSKSLASGDTCWAIDDNGGPAGANTELVMTAATPGGGGVVFPPVEWLGAGNDNNVDIAVSAAGPLALGWDITLTFADPVRKFPVGNADNTTVTVVYLHLQREYTTGNSKTGDVGKNAGMYRMGWDGTLDASLLSSWNMPYNAWAMIYAGSADPEDKFGFLIGLVDFGYSSDPTAAAPGGFFARVANNEYLNNPNAGNLPQLRLRAQVDGAYPPLSTVRFDEPIDYNPIALGYMRNDLYEGKDLTPDAPDNQFDTVDPADNGGNGGKSVGGADILAEIIPSFDGTMVPIVRVSKTTQTGGSTYLGPNWRTRTIVLEKKVDDATIMPSFNPPNYIKLTVEITGIQGVNVSISFAAEPTDDFTPNTKLLVSTSNTGAPVVKINSTIKERWFPLRPAIGLCTTAWYFSVPAYIQGEYDTTLISGNGLIGSQAENQTEGGELDVSPHEVGAPTTIQLRHLWKFGQLQDSDVGAGAGQVPVNQREPNTASVATTLSLPKFVILRNQAPTDAAVGFPQTQVNTGGALLETGESPNLSVEINDFNIKGYNGATSDINKCVAVISKEELASGQTTGSLHYVPPYPIKIDLNVPTTKALNSLTVALRDIDSGKIVDELAYPTTLTLLHEQSEMSKMEKMMNKVMLKAADRNNTQNNLIGMNNPRV